MPELRCVQIPQFSALCTYKNIILYNYKAGFYPYLLSVFSYCCQKMYASDSGLTDNTTFMTCAAESLQNDTVYVDPTYQPYVRYVQLVYYIFVFIVDLPLNWFVILLVIKNKTLHTLSFAVAMQVVVLNVFIVSILVSLNIISLSANRWLFGEYVCAINGVDLLH